MTNVVAGPLNRSWCPYHHQIGQDSLAPMSLDYAADHLTSAVTFAHDGQAPSSGMCGTDTRPRRMTDEVRVRELTHEESSPRSMSLSRWPSTPPSLPLRPRATNDSLPSPISNRSLRRPDSAHRPVAIVELVVWAGPQRSTGPGSVESGTPPVARGIAQTERFGAQLHVAVVVAEASAIIAPGAIHSYDVIVGGQGLRDLGLLRDEAAHAGGRRRRRPPAAPRPRLRARSVAELRHPSPDDRRPRARPGLVPADERRRSRRDGLPRRPHRRAPPRPDAAPAAAVPHRRPDLRRRPVGLPAAADQRHRPGAARVHRDPADRQPRRPGHDRGVSRAAPPQGGPRDRSVLHQRRPAPPALLRRAAGDAPAGVEPLAVAPADHRRRGVRAVPERSRRTTCRTGRRTTSRSRAIRTRTV